HDSLCLTVAPPPQLLRRERARIYPKGASMKAFGAALILSLSLLGAEHALAADMPLPGGAPIPPASYYPVSPPVNWGGVYIGVNGGYGIGQSNYTDSKGSTGNFAANGGVA